MRNRQGGMTLIGILLIAGLVALVGYGVIRLIPVYMTQMKVKNICPAWRRSSWAESQRRTDPELDQRVDIDMVTIPARQISPLRNRPACVSRSTTATGALHRQSVLVATFEDAVEITRWTQAADWVDGASLQIQGSGAARTGADAPERLGGPQRAAVPGDAVLGLVVADPVCGSSGSLRRCDGRRWARLVRSATLEAPGCGADLGAAQARQRSPHGGHRRGSILANALEAVFGAIFLDGGYEAAGKADLPPARIPCRRVRRARRAA